MGTCFIPVSAIHPNTLVTHRDVTGPGRVLPRGPSSRRVVGKLTIRVGSLHVYGRRRSREGVDDPVFETGYNCSEIRIAIRSLLYDLPESREPMGIGVACNRLQPCPGGYGQTKLIQFTHETKGPLGVHSGVGHPHQPHTYCFE